MRRMTMARILASFPGCNADRVVLGDVGNNSLFVEYPTTWSSALLAHQARHRSPYNPDTRKQRSMSPPNSSPSSMIDYRLSVVIVEAACKSRFRFQPGQLLQLPDCQSCPGWRHYCNWQAEPTVLAANMVYMDVARASIRWITPMSSSSVVAGDVINHSCHLTRFVPVAMMWNLRVVYSAGQQHRRNPECRTDTFRI